jgi:putative hydrolase of HD superfamily
VRPPRGRYDPGNDRRSRRAPRERAAVADLLGPFDAAGDETGPDGLGAPWDDYEARETPTARFVEEMDQMDLIDSCLQALAYESGDRYDDADPDDQFAEFDDLDEFFATAAPRLRTDVGERLFAELKTRYERMLGRPCELEP